MEHGRRQGAFLSGFIRTVGETGSTNADVMALAAAGAVEGLWLRAERQMAGKGRLGRQWVSPPGNFYASTLVRLRANDPPPATLALLTAVALHQVVMAYLPAGAAPVMLKWPNDLLIDGAKLSGILAERAGDAVVVGIGVNLAHCPADVPRATTSLAAHGADVDPDDFAQTLCQAFERWLARWRGEGPGVVTARWAALAHPEGTALAVHLPDGEQVAGLFERLDGDGTLILRLADGARRAIHAGDVFLL